MRAGIKTGRKIQLTKEAQDVKTYKALLPPQRQRLLTCCQPHKPYDLNTLRPLINTPQNNPIIECGSDGSLPDKMGTFGYTMSINGQVFWEGAGPAERR